MLPIDTPKDVDRDTSRYAFNDNTGRRDDYVGCEKRFEPNAFSHLLQKQLRKLNGISSHLKRKRKEEKKTNGDKKRKRDEDDETERAHTSWIQLDFASLLSKKIMKILTVSQRVRWKKLKLYFENVCSGTCETMSRSQTK